MLIIILMLIRKLKLIN